MAWINLTNLTQAVSEIKAYCVAAFKPDWNEYDSTSTKYIANRPFYHDYDTDTVLADTAFSTNYADYDITVSGYDYALISACENVTLAKDITAGTSYHVKAGIDGAYEKDVIAGSSTTYTLNGAGSTKTVTGIPLVVTGYCIIVRTASKKATILLAGRANQYPVTGQTIGIGEVTVDDLQTIDPEFLPAATSSAYGAVKVDTALSVYSHNPVENQAVKTALNDIDAKIGAVGSTDLQSQVTSLRESVSVTSTLKNVEFNHPNTTNFGIQFTASDNSVITFIVDRTNHRLALFQDNTWYIFSPDN